MLVLLTILSCDTFKEDFIEPGNQVIFSTTEYYVLPGSPLVIDLESAIKESYTNTSLTVSENPKRGTLSKLGTLLLKYYPGHKFLEGEDQFVFSILSNNEVIATETMRIFIKQDVEELPCPLYAVGDKLHVRPGSTVSVNFLKNDRICEVDDAQLQISIHMSPRFGEGKLVGDSIIVYTPGPGYLGRDGLVYKLSDSSGENFSYGFINISEWDVQFFATPITPMWDKISPLISDLTEIFFVNDSTGFLGGYGIYKTTDGGATWKESLPITVFSDDANHYSARAYTDIYFFDADHGYASYTEGSCTCSITGLLQTVDGGDTWKDVFFPHDIFFGPTAPVTSTFFTSLTTGFVGVTYPPEDGADTDLPSHSIRKTDDGGITWKDVLTNEAGFSSLNIRFADSKTGYAYDNYTMYKTIDGGESWNLAYEKEYIMSLAVTPLNILSANFTSGSVLETSPSTMFQSRDGEAWSPTINFPYAILEQRFSPNGNIGFAAGVSATDPSFVAYKIKEQGGSQTLSINRSADKGATWTEFETEERLYGYPLSMAIPSDNVAYVLGFREVIKLTRP